MDYEKIEKIARRLIERNGRAIELQLLSRQIKDATKPWAGAGKQDVEDSADTHGVFLPAGMSLTDFGLSKTDEELLKRSDQLCIAAPMIDGTDLSQYHLVFDHEVLWKIDTCTVLRPGNFILLYYFGLSR